MLFTDLGFGFLVSLALECAHCPSRCGQWGVVQAGGSWDSCIQALLTCATGLRTSQASLEDHFILGWMLAAVSPRPGREPGPRGAQQCPWEECTWCGVSTLRHLMGAAELSQGGNSGVWSGEQEFSSLRGADLDADSFLGKQIFLGLVSLDSHMSWVRYLVSRSTWVKSLWVITWEEAGRVSYDIIEGKEDPGCCLCAPDSAGSS